MDHSEAIRLGATERYLLGELAGDLRAQFEEHFMSCPDCARDVRAGAVFVENAREVLRTQAPAKARAKTTKDTSRGWLALLFRPAIAAPAFAILLVIIGYQAGMTIPRLESSLSKANSPRALTSFSLINDNSRGGAPATFTVRPDQPFSLYVDVPPQPSFSKYTFEVENQTGNIQFALSISAEEARNTVQVLVPPSRLSPGQYALVIRGSSKPDETPGTEVARYSFALDYGQPTNSPIQ